MEEREYGTVPHESGALLLLSQEKEVAMWGGGVGYCSYQDQSVRFSVRYAAMPDACGFYMKTHNALTDSQRDI